MPGATTYFGCVGDDHYAEELKKVASKDGVNVSERERLTAAGRFLCFLAEREQLAIEQPSP